MSEPPDPKNTMVLFSLHGGIFFWPRLPNDPPIVRVPVPQSAVVRWRDASSPFTPHREFRRVYAFCDELPFYMEQ